MARASRFCWPNESASGGRSRIPSRSIERRPAQAVGDRARRTWPGRDRRFVGPERQLLADRPGEQHLARALEDVAEVVASSAVVRAPAIDAVHEDPPGGQRQELHRRPEGRGLAGAVRAEDGHDLAPAEVGRRRRGGPDAHRSTHRRRGTRGGAVASPIGSQRPWLVDGARRHGLLEPRRRDGALRGRCRMAT